MSAPSYRSDIPVHAEQRVTQRGPDGKPQRAEFWLDGVVVGWRLYDEHGAPVWEQAYRNGRPHGMEYEWDLGRLRFAEPYVDGLPHGTAFEWDAVGNLIGSFVMVHGTGLDPWWDWLPDDPPYLAELRTFVAGRRHGFEWWLNPDHTVYEERHWWQDQLHGIERAWNFAGRLRRGYPNYYVHGVEVTKRQYLRAADKDPTLPPFRLEDQLPIREFPPEVQAHLRSACRHASGPT